MRNRIERRVEGVMCQWKVYQDGGHTASLDTEIMTQWRRGNGFGGGVWAEKYLEHSGRSCSCWELGSFLGPNRKEENGNRSEFTCRSFFFF